MKIDAFERACALDAAGEIEDARAAYLEVLAADPRHFEALTNLGTLLYTHGFRRAGKLTLAEAVKQHPERVVAHVNLASALLDEGDHAASREQFDLALRLDPHDVQAHRGLAILLVRCGDLEAAQVHARIGMRDQAERALPFRGSEGSKRMLILTSALGGNVDTERIIGNRLLACDVVIAEFYEPSMPLPAYECIFNAIGDAERSVVALERANDLVSASAARIFNHPDAVLATTRVANAQRLGALPGVRTAITHLFSREQIAAAEMAYPLLVRSPGYHTGEHFVRVDTENALAQTIAKLPGDELLVIEYLDTRAADGAFRKYRMLIVDGVLYPLHLAIADDWKVHYYTADMSSPERKAEELAFLRDSASALGDAAMVALRSIAEMLALDYGGIDFTLDREGQVVVFEANATMNLLPPGEGALPERLMALETVREAVAVMLRRKE